MDVLDRILKLRNDRGWTEYRLSEESGIAQSTISSWYKKGMNPTIASLESICAAFGITLSQFFAEGESSVVLTPEQKEMLSKWSGLTDEQKEALFSLIKSM